MDALVASGAARPRPPAATVALVALAVVVAVGLTYLVGLALGGLRPIRGRASFGPPSEDDADGTVVTSDQAAETAPRLSAAEGAAVAEEPVAEEPVAEESEAEVPEAPAKPRHRLRGLAGWVVYLAVIIAAIALGPRIMGWALDTDHPIATVSGDSMWPALKQGDLVLLKGVSGIDELKVGDIIGFRHADGVAIHRITRIEGDEIIARGDANFRDDPPVGIEDVVGKVPTILGGTARIPYLGHITSLLGPLSSNELAGGPSTADDQGDDLSARQ